MHLTRELAQCTLLHYVSYHFLAKTINFQGKTQDWAAQRSFDVPTELANYVHRGGTLSVHFVHLSVCPTLSKIAQKPTNQFQLNLVAGCGMHQGRTYYISEQF